MTTIAITNKVIATDQKIVVSDLFGQYTTEFKDKLIVTPNKTFIATGSGRFNYSVTSEEFGELESELITLFSAARIYFKHYNVKITSEEEPKLHKMISEIGVKIATLFSIKLEDERVIYPEFLILVSKHCCLYFDGINGVDGNHSTGDFSLTRGGLGKGARSNYKNYDVLRKNEEYIKFLQKTPLASKFVFIRNKGIQVFAFGTGKRYVKIGLSLGYGPLYSVKTAARNDPLSGLVDKEPNHLYFKDMNNIKYLTIKQVRNILGEIK